MKKLSVILALILCLVMVAFAFASCGPKKPASTTADGAAPSSTTEHAHKAATGKNSLNEVLIVFFHYDS